MDAVWAYARVSTRKEEQEDSLDDQVRRAEAHATAHGLLLRTFQEQASAKTIAGRPVLTSLLAELEALSARQRPKVLFGTALDRLSRDIVESMYIGRTLRMLKVALFVFGRGEVKLETFAQRAVFVGESLGGDAENEAKSKRARDSWDRRRREGKPTSNKHPYGLQLIAERDAPIPESAEWVLKAFHWYDSGIGSHVIGNRFRDGAPTHTWLTSRVGDDGERVRKTRLTRWEGLRVVKLLRLRRYRGTIVEEALFDRVQQRLDSRPKSGSRRIREYPLSGAMECSKCGRHLCGIASGGSQRRTLIGGARTTYYSRRTRYYGCRVCNYRLNAEKLESAFFATIGDLVASDKLLQSWIHAPQIRVSEALSLKRELQSLSKELDAGSIQKSRDKLFDLAVGGGCSEAEFRRQLQRLEANELQMKLRFQELENVLKRDESTARSIGHAKGLLANFKLLYEKSTYEEKRIIVEALVDALGGLTVSPQGLSWGARAATKSQRQRSPRNHVNLNTY